MVYKGLQSSFVSLAWPWSGRSLPKENQWECWGPLTGAQYGWAPSSPTTNDVTNLKSDRLTFLHMAGWLANCRWLAGYLKKVNLTPRQRHLVAKCDTTLPWLRLTFDQMYPPGRDNLWPSVILLHLWVRLNFGQMYPPGRDILWPSVVLLHLWVRVTYGQMYPQQRHLVAKCVTTAVRLTSGQTSPPRGLLHERHFIQRGYYLVLFCCAWTLWFYWWNAYISVCHLLKLGSLAGNHTWLCYAHTCIRYYFSFCFIKQLFFALWMIL